MKTTILRYKANWADEMDIYGLVFADPEEADLVFELLPKHEEGFEVYVGTSEEIYYDNGSELLRNITRVDLTEDEAKAVTKALGNNYWWGLFPDIVWDIVEELKETK